MKYLQKLYHDCKVTLLPPPPFLRLWYEALNKDKSICFPFIFGKPLTTHVGADNFHCDTQNTLPCFFAQNARLQPELKFFFLKNVVYKWWQICLYTLFHTYLWTCAPFAYSVGKDYFWRCGVEAWQEMVPAKAGPGLNCFCFVCFPLHK